MTLASTIVALGAVGYWKLDEASGTNANDSTAGNRDGTYAGTYTLAAVTGPDGVGYASFGGGQVTIADADDWTINTSGNGLTVFCLARPTSLTLGMFVSKATGANYEWQMTVGTPNASSFAGAIWNSIASAGASRAIDTITINAWQALAFAAGHAPTTSTMDLNRNGSYLTGTVTGSATMSNGTGPLVIGHRGDGAAGHDFTGALAYVAIFPRRLSTTDMGTLMTAANAWIAGADFDPVDIAGAPTVVTAHTAVAAVTATTTSNPAATIVAAHSAVAAVTATAAVTPAATVITAHTAVGNVATVPVAVGSIVTAHTAVAAVTATATVTAIGTVVVVVAAVARRTNIIFSAGRTFRVKSEPRIYRVRPESRIYLVKGAP